jgi:hypothetical protein
MHKKMPYLCDLSVTADASYQFDMVAQEQDGIYVNTERPCFRLAFR